MAVNIGEIEGGSSSKMFKTVGHRVAEDQILFFL